MKGGQIVAGESVRGGARVLQFGLITRGRKLLRAAEHEVLEEMREAALAGLDFVARARADDDEERDDVGIVGRDGDQAEAVWQVFLHVRVREDFRGGENES